MEGERHGFLSIDGNLSATRDALGMIDRMSGHLEYSLPIPLRRQRRIQRFVFGAILLFLFAAGVLILPPLLKDALNRRQARLNASVFESVNGGNVNEVRSLIRAGADVESIDGKIPILAIAVRRRDKAMVDLLLAKGASADPAESYPLAFAIDNDDEAMIEQLVSHKASVDGRVEQEPMLCRACRGGHTGAVRILLSHGANPNITGRYAISPLDMAVESNDILAVNLLVNAGANVNGFRVSLSPLENAAWRNEPEIANALTVHGAKPTIWSVVAFGDITTLQELERTNSAAMSTGSARFPGRGPIFLAALNGRHDMFSYLHSQGRGPDGPDVYGLTLLHAAATSGDVEIVRMLLDSGAPIDAATPQGDTALHYAASHGKTDAAVLLIRRGANINARNNLGRTPLGLAVDEHRDSTALVLKSHGGEL